MIRFIVFVSLIASTAFGANEPTSQTTAETDSSIKADIRSSITVGAGSSTNVGRLPNDQEGAYLKLSPKFELSVIPSDTTYFGTRIDGTIRRFVDPSHNDLGSSLNGKITTEAFFYPSSKTEVGITGFTSYTESKSTWYDRNTGISQAEPSNFTTVGGKLAGAYLGKSASVEAGIKITDQNYSSLSTDYVGRKYFEDNLVYGPDIKVSVKLAKKTRLSLRSSLYKKHYSDRMAEHTDGRPVETGIHPKLTELYQDNQLKLKYRLGSLKLSSQVSYGFVKDQIFGARDQSIAGFKQTAKIPLFAKNMSVSPSAAIFRTGYSNFRSILDQPAVETAPLRTDWTLSFGLPFTHKLNRTLKWSAGYNYSQTLSNYVADEYIEHQIDAGLTVSF